jgi:phosphatidylglycerol:prolipoprotein diacylglycerol transferase
METQNYFIHKLNPIICSIGPFQIAWYGVFYVISFAIGYFLLKQNYKHKGVPIVSEHYESFIIHIILGVIIGGRLGYVLFYRFTDYLADPIRILYFQEGGMSFHGGLLGVIIASLIFCKRYGYNFYTLADPAMPIVAIGVGIVRIANFINGELYGKVTDVRWAVIFQNTDPEALPRHPSQLYESFLEGFLMAVILQFLLFKVKMRGLIFWTFIGLYGVIRYLIEFIRIPDDLPIYDNGMLFGIFSMGQFLSLLMIFNTIFALIILKSRENHL